MAILSLIVSEDKVQYRHVLFMTDLFLQGAIAMSLLSKPSGPVRPHMGYQSHIPFSFLKTMEDFSMFPPKRGIPKSEIFQL